MDKIPWGPCSPWPKQMGEEGPVVDLYPVFNTAEERQEYIKSNADYYVVTWKQNRKYPRFEYKSLDKARLNATFAANVRQHPILIYGVVTPFSDESEPYGYSSWIETVNPNKEVKNEQ